MTAHLAYSTAIAKAPKGTLGLALPEDFELGQHPNAWEALYAFVRAETGTSDTGLHGRVIVGVDAMRSLRAIEKTRLSRRYRGRELTEAVAWSDMGSGPQELLGGRKLAGRSVLVLPDESAGTAGDAGTNSNPSR